MTFAPHGSGTSEVEITNVSKHGFWILLDNRELFLSFEQFPWFRDTTLANLFTVELPQPDHLYWPKLDIDLAVDSIDHPERYPLISKSMPSSDDAPS